MSRQDIISGGKKHKIRSLRVKSVLGLSILLILVLWMFFCLIPFYRHNYVPEEQQPFKLKGWRHTDDTLRVAVIGDSWALIHTKLSGDSLFGHIAGQLLDCPVKCATRGKSHATSKDIYHFMFSNIVQQPCYDPYCSATPLLEEHPDYCVIFAGINDAILLRPSAFYTGNIKTIIRQLLHNGIRPVLMELPPFSQTNGLKWMKLWKQAFIRISGMFMGTYHNDIPYYRKELKGMLQRTHLRDSILYIPADSWNTSREPDINLYYSDAVHLNLKGYQLLDSCIASEIAKDYNEHNNK